MQSLNVSYSAFGKHTCTRVPSSEVAIKKIKRLQQLLQLLFLQNFLLYFYFPRYLPTPLSRPLPPQNNMEHVQVAQRE